MWLDSWILGRCSLKPLDHVALIKWREEGTGYTYYFVLYRGIVQEEELLTINVQPGWKKGTKVTFEGKGNERPGAYREDIIFFISEKRHQLFRREGEDLELGVEIPLVKALTGCTISVPLLGGGKMSLTVDDIIYPGFEKIITDQGMPVSKQEGVRGNLKITFLVEFPTQLTDNQRSEVFCILQDSCCSKGFLDP